MCVRAHAHTHIPWPGTSRLTMKSFKGKKRSDKKDQIWHQPDTRPIKGEVGIITRHNLSGRRAPANIDQK